MNKIRVEITPGTIIKTILILLGVYFLFLIRDVIALFFIAVIIASAVEPAVDWMKKKKIPRVAGVLIVYVFVFLIIGVGLSFLVQPIAQQFSEFSQNIPTYYQEIQNTFGSVNDFFQANHLNVSSQNFFENLSRWLSDVPGNIFSTTIGVFSGIISSIAVFSIAFYLAAADGGLQKMVAFMTPEKYEKRANDLTLKIKNNIGKWLQGQVFLMIIIFILDYIGLSIIGVPYALVLAALAGLLEIIPYVGPIVSAIPGVVLGFLISPVKGLLALLVYVIVQQAENNVIVPLIMKKALGLNPITIILALLAGAKLGGVLGAILAVPIAMIASLVIKELFFKDEPVEKGITI